METEEKPLPPAYQKAIRAEVRDVLRQSGKQIAEEQGYTKRDVLQMGGFVALGALMGTGGLAAMAGPAAAAPTGEIGTPTEPIDKIYADEIGTSSNPVTAITTGQVDNDDYHEKVVTQSGSTGSLDLSAANVFEQTVTGNISFSFNNPEATPAGNSFLLIVIQDGTGGHTLSWPAAVEWGGGSAPGVSTAANDKHIFSFQSPDGGTTWYGFLAAENVA